MYPRWACEVSSKEKSQAVKLCLLCSLYLENYFHGGPTPPLILPPSYHFSVFPLKYMTTKTCLTVWQCCKKLRLSLQYKLWINVSHEAKCKKIRLWFVCSLLQCEQWVMWWRSEGSPSQRPTVSWGQLYGLTWTNRNTERRHCFLVWAHPHSNVLTPSCEGSPGLLTPEIWYLLRLQMMGW